MRHTYNQWGSLVLGFKVSTERNFSTEMKKLDIGDGHFFEMSLVLTLRDSFYFLLRYSSHIIEYTLLKYAVQGYETIATI